MEKICDTCDYDREREYNTKSMCPENTPGKGGCNEMYDMYKWKLRRDYNQENKEQEMSYKPTSSCTLKNIAEKIEVTNCDEARAEYFKFALELERDGYNAGISKSVIQIDSPVWIRITKTEKRRNWLLKFGFIEEEISLKPCCHCGKTTPLFIKETGESYQVVCNWNEKGCGAGSGFRDTREEAIEQHNIRK